MSGAVHTPGPWRWDYRPTDRGLRLLGGRVRYDLTVIDFVRCGMGGAIPRFRDTAHDGLQLLHRLNDRPDWIKPEQGREHHSDWHQLVTHPDARLIEAAPDMRDALDSLLFWAKHPDDSALKRVKRAEVFAFAEAALAKATGSASHG